MKNAVSGIGIAVIWASASLAQGYAGDVAISEDDLRTFLIGHLAKFKIPRYFIMTTEPLLRIASGKIDKRLIRASAAQTHGLDS